VQHLAWREMMRKSVPESSYLSKCPISFSDELPALNSKSEVHP